METWLFLQCDFKKSSYIRECNVKDYQNDNSRAVWEFHPKNLKSTFTMRYHSLGKERDYYRSHSSLRTNLN